MFQLTICPHSKAIMGLFQPLPWIRSYLLLCWVGLNLMWPSVFTGCKFYWNYTPRMVKNKLKKNTKNELYRSQPQDWKYRDTQRYERIALLAENQKRENWESVHRTQIICPAPTCISYKIIKGHKWRLTKVMLPKIHTWFVFCGNGRCE